MLGMTTREGVGGWALVAAALGGVRAMVETGSIPLRAATVVLRCSKGNENSRQRGKVSKSEVVIESGF